MTSGTLVNLNWHGLGTPDRALDRGEERVWVRVDTFERVLDLVADRADVRLTFDDGNRSDVDLALPRLVERGLTASFFVLAGRLGEPGRLDAPALRELVDAGMGVGSHGWAHRDWRCLRGSEVREEIEHAPRVLSEMTGRAVDTVAIPFGSYDGRVLRTLRRTGVRRAYTSDGGRVDPSHWLQGRVSVRDDTTVDDIRALLERRPSPPIRAARSAVQWAKRHRPGSRADAGHTG